MFWCFQFVVYGGRVVFCGLEKVFRYRDIDIVGGSWQDDLGVGGGVLMEFVFIVSYGIGFLGFYLEEDIIIFIYMSLVIVSYIVMQNVKGMEDVIVMYFYVFWREYQNICVQFIEKYRDLVWIEFVLRR